MDMQYISRQEHDEFVKRMDTDHKRLEEEDRRQNKRIDALEGAMKEISNISISVERLAVNMEAMCKVQERQGKRLETLENRDGEKWRKVLEYIGFAIVGAVLAIVFAKIGL